MGGAERPLLLVVKVRVSFLRGALANTKKLDKTAEQYIAMMKGFAAELVATGKQVDDDEVRDYILAGLDGEYNSLVASINANPSTTLNDMCAQLTAYDFRNKMLSESAGIFSSSANVAGRSSNNGYRSHNSGGQGRQRGGHGYQPRRNHGQNRGHGRRGRGRGRGRGRVPSPPQDVTCQICKKFGHPASECWWRYSDNNDDDDSYTEEKGAYGVDTNWYMDSGATDHITRELHKMTTRDTYKGHDQVHNASGANCAYRSFNILYPP